MIFKSVVITCCDYTLLLFILYIFFYWFRANISQHRILHCHGIAFADFDCELWRVAHWHPESWLYYFFNLVIWLSLVVCFSTWLFVFVQCGYLFSFSIWLVGYLFFQFGYLFLFSNLVFRFGFAKSQEVGGQAVEPQAWISNVLLAHGLVSAAPQPGDASGFHILPLCLWHHSSCKRNSSQGQSQCWQGAGFKTITQ